MKYEIANKNFLRAKLMLLENIKGPFIIYWRGKGGLGDFRGGPEILATKKGGVLE